MTYYAEIKMWFNNWCACLFGIALQLASGVMHSTSCCTKMRNYEYDVPVNSVYIWNMGLVEILNS